MSRSGNAGEEPDPGFSEEERARIKAFSGNPADLLPDGEYLKSTPYSERRRER